MPCWPSGRWIFRCMQASMVLQQLADQEVMQTLALNKGHYAAKRKVQSYAKGHKERLDSDDEDEPRSPQPPPVRTSDVAPGSSAPTSARISDTPGSRYSPIVGLVAASQAAQLQQRSSPQAGPSSSPPPAPAQQQLEQQQQQPQQHQMMHAKVHINAKTGRATLVRSEVVPGAAPPQPPPSWFVEPEEVLQRREQETRQLMEQLGLDNYFIGPGAVVKARPSSRPDFAPPGFSNQDLESHAPPQVPSSHQSARTPWGFPGASRPDTAEIVSNRGLSLRLNSRYPGAACPPCRRPSDQRFSLVAQDPALERIWSGNQGDVSTYYSDEGSSRGGWRGETPGSIEVGPMPDGWDDGSMQLRAGTAPEGAKRPGSSASQSRSRRPVSAGGSFAASQQARDRPIAPSAAGWFRDENPAILGAVTGGWGRPRGRYYGPSNNAGNSRRGALPSPAGGRGVAPALGLAARIDDPGRRRGGRGASGPCFCCLDRIRTAPCGTPNRRLTRRCCLDLHRRFRLRSAPCPLLQGQRSTPTYRPVVGEFEQMSSALLGSSTARKSAGTSSDRNASQVRSEPAPMDWHREPRSP